MCNLLKDKRIVLKTKYTTVIVDQNQFYRGRLLAIFNKHVESEKDLKKEELSNFFLDAVKAGIASQEATKALRVNYGWFNNRDAHIHLHIIPRHSTDPDPNRNPWLHNGKIIADSKELDKLYKDLIEVIK